LRWSTVEVVSGVINVVVDERAGNLVRVVAIMVSAIDAAHWITLRERQAAPSLVKPDRAEP